MTEYEIVNVAGTAFGNGLNSFAVFFSIVTAYLIVAYTAAKGLTRLQIFIVNLCYLLATSFFGLFTVSTFLRGIQMARVASETQSVGAYHGIGKAAWVYVAIIVIVVILASLYFMWSVRHPNTE